MGASWRIGVNPDERTKLVTGGVFAHVRKPISTAILAARAASCSWCRPGSAPPR